MAPPERGGGPGRGALAWEGLELPRWPEGIAGMLELGDGGPRPARPGYGFLLDRGVCVSAGWCSRRLGGSIYRRAARVLRAPPVDTCPRRPATSGVSERGRRRRRSRGHCGRAETSTGSRGWRRAQCAPHCWAGRTLPVLAAASSGVGECQGGCRSRYKDGGVVWQAPAGVEASMRGIERSAALRARRLAAWHGAHAWSSRELCLLADLVPQIMSSVLFVVDMSVTQV